MQPESIVYLQENDASYPLALRRYLGSAAPPRLSALGNLDVLQCRSLALFCSVRCPGNLILQTYDFTQTLRQAGVTVIGGFHAPMEHECLTILLRSTQPIIVCPARSIAGMRVRPEYQRPLAEGRLLLLSPFAQTPRRITAETAVVRNFLVAALADVIFVAHAAPDSKTAQFCRDVLAWPKALYTLESNANGHLIALGAKPVAPGKALAWITAHFPAVAKR
jgi:predicted Rossmann fold nucleotide-binding protein DprA/Smf involved in DNA uptake